ncbi:MAG: hypothetical protein QXX38_00960 [Candidatus Aenigmatarchaeota archaeon]
MIKWKNITITSLLYEISKKHNIPESTLRWNAKKLKELGIIECGDQKNKGIPVKITNLGIIFLNFLKEGENEIQQKRKRNYK